MATPGRTACFWGREGGERGGGGGFWGGMNDEGAGLRRGSWADEPTGGEGACGGGGGVAVAIRYSWRG